MATVKVRASKAEGLKGKTDWEKLKTINDADIGVAVTGDPDSSLLGNDDLAKFKKEHKNHTNK